MHRIFIVLVMFLFATQSGAAPSIVKVTNISGKWQLRVNGQPFIVKSVNYDSWKVGTCNDSWKNHLAMNPNEEDAWIDMNKNNVRDANEPIVGDWAIMKSMGINAIRDFQNGNQAYADYTQYKPIFQAMYANYGIMVVMNSFFGMYGVGAVGTCDYGDAADRASVLKSVTNVVRAYKDEPYILMWVLGNENNYNQSCNAANNPAYGTLLQEAALAIKAIDPNHPVANCDGDMGNMNITKTAPALDIFGLNCYRGRTGFGDVFSRTKTEFDRPVFFLEYGGPWEEDHAIPNWDWWGNWTDFESIQVATHSNCWSQIIQESYIGTGVSGNAIGGTWAHYIDRWGEHGSCNVQNDGDNGGIFSQGNGSQSPHMRQWRPVATYYKRVWNDSSLYRNVVIQVFPNNTVKTGLITIKVSAFTQVGNMLLKAVTPTGVTNILINLPPGTSTNYQTTYQITTNSANGTWWFIATGTIGSTAVRQTFSIVVDTVGPTPPTTPYAVNHEDALVLGWKEGLDTSTSVVSYKIYRSLNEHSGFVQVASVSNLSWIDTSAVENVTYYYRIASVDVVGNVGAMSPVFTGKLTKSDYTIYPVPVKSGQPVNIGLNLPETTKLNVGIYDMSGRLVKQISKNEEFSKGWTSVVWDGKDARDKNVGRGVYYCVFKSSREEKRKKLVVVD